MTKITKDKIRGIYWGNTFMWEIKLDSRIVGAPFDSWIPATDVEEGLWNLETHQMEAYMSNYEFALKTSALDIKVTFADTVDSVIREGLRRWVVEDILNNGKCIGYHHDIKREIIIYKYLPNGTLLQTNSYWVLPKGSAYWNGNNTAELATGMVEFVVVGVKYQKIGKVHSVLSLNV